MIRQAILAFAIVLASAPGAPALAYPGESSASILARMKSVCRREREAAVNLIMSAFGDRAYSEQLADAPLQGIGNIKTVESLNRLERSSRDGAREYPALAAQTLYPACVYAARARELAASGVAANPAPAPAASRPAPSAPPSQPPRNPASPGSFNSQVTYPPPRSDPLPRAVARGPASEGPTSVYKDPDTGQDCVRMQGQTVKTEGYYHTYTLTLTNSCDRNFSITLWEDPPGRPRKERRGIIYRAKPDGSPNTAVFSCLEARKAENSSLSSCQGGFSEWSAK